MKQVLRWEKCLLALALCSILILEQALAAGSTELDVRRHREKRGDVATFGLVVNQFDYGEIRRSKTIDSENGILTGLRAGYERRFSRTEWFAAANLSAVFGSTDYEGGTWVPGGSGAIRPLSATTSNSMVNLEVLGGWGDGFIAPYTGIGMNYWLRDTSSTPSGYIENYLWFYLPVGVRVRETIGPRFSVTEDVSMRWNMGGVIAATFPNHDIQPTGGSLGMAFGFRAEVPFVYRVDEDFRIIAGPFFEYLPIGMGEGFYMTKWSGKVLTRAQEPDSDSFRYGLTAGIQLSL